MKFVRSCVTHAAADGLLTAMRNSETASELFRISSNLFSRAGAPLAVNWADAGRLGGR